MTDSVTRRHECRFLAACVVRAGPAGWTLQGKRETVATLIPATLRALIEHQLAHCSTAAQTLLAAASVAGVELDAAQAEAHYQQARTLAAGLGMRPLVAHCHRSLGTLYATTDRQEEAWAALRTARTLYQSMDMTLWLPCVGGGPPH